MRNRRGSAGRRVAAGVVALALLGVAGLLLGLREDGGSVDGAAPPSPVPDVHYLTVDGAVLAGLPASGQAWDAVVAAAAGDLGEPDLADQHNVNAGRTFAAALVYARTGDQGYREAVVAELEDLRGSDMDGVRVLSSSRQLAGYVIAADLAGYRDAGFVQWVGSLLEADLGGHGRWREISATTESTASNWGAWALASRIAVSLYVGDTADVARAAEVFRGFTGERSAYSGFAKTDDFDPTWACDPAAWVPINPASCGDRAGAIVEDISRSKGSYPEYDKTGVMYSWEVLGGATLSAKLLSRHGYPDVYEWGDRALLRAAEFLRTHGGYPPRYSTNQYIPWAINSAYGVDLGPVGPAGHGRQYGFTDWLP